MFKSSFETKEFPRNDFETGDQNLKDVYSVR